MWHEKIDIDNDKLQFRVFQDNQTSIINSNKYIVIGGVGLNNCVILATGSTNYVPKLRSSRATTNQ